MEKFNEELMKEMILASRFIVRPHGRAMGQERILKKLADGPISQKDLQEIMEVRPGSISEIVSKLEEKGLLERSKSEDDARAVTLAITEKGKERLSTLEQQKDLFSSLNDDEKAQLKDLLTKLNNDWIRREPMHHHGHHHEHHHDRCHMDGKDVMYHHNPDTKCRTNKEFFWFYM